MNKTINLEVLGLEELNEVEVKSVEGGYALAVGIGFAIVGWYIYDNYYR